MANKKKSPKDYGRWDDTGIKVISKPKEPSEKKKIVKKTKRGK